MTTTLARISGVLLLAFALITPGVSVHAATTPTATIDAATLSTDKTKPSLTGDAANVATLKVEVLKNGKRIFKSKTLKVRDGHWKVTSKKKLTTGSYTVVVYDAKDKKKKTLATGTLTVGSTSTGSKSSGKSGGVISVGALGLLSGGVAAPSASVPVAYIRVQNNSTEAVQLEGFTFKQNGSASGNSVIGFTTSDDKGGSRTTIGGSEGTVLFKNGSTYVPLAATISPNQVRIFTIKATMSKNPGSDLGKQLFLDVAGVTANGGIKASYPIRGVAWTVTR